MKQHDDAGLDIEAYRKQTDDLITSMNETTDLLSEMSDNMAKLGETFENFGQTKDQLRMARTDLQESKPAVAAD